MRNNYDKDGYTASIQKGIRYVRSICGRPTFGNNGNESNVNALKEAIENADGIVIGAGAGLSAAAGLTYAGERFERYFFDFEKAYSIHDMYSGGFYPFPDEETSWAWWARHIYYNRYIDAPKAVYQALLSLVKDKDYFVITTNVDHQFQRAGFDKRRLFYTQGDYGLFQSDDPSDGITYDNESWVMTAMEAQGFMRDENGVFQVKDRESIKMRIPPDMIPKTPNGGKAVMNLRSDDRFVKDEGWHRASKAYGEFLMRRQNSRVLFFELGVGGNTPMIIKYPFWAMTAENKRATYACLNFEEAVCPVELETQSILLRGDAHELLDKLQS